MPQASCISSGSPSARASVTAAKPFAASSTPPTTPGTRPTVRMRLLPPSLREPDARRSTPFRRAIAYGNEIEPTRYATAMATLYTVRIVSGDGRLPLLPHRRLQGPGADRLRGRRRHGDQRRLPARAVPRPGPAEGARASSHRPRGRAARGSPPSGRAPRCPRGRPRRSLPAGGEQRLRLGAVDRTPPHARHGRPALRLATGIAGKMRICTVPRKASGGYDSSSRRAHHEAARRLSPMTKGRVIPVVV